MNIQKNISTNEIPNWCPGCGNFSILTALKNTLIELDIDTKNIVIVSGIGCSSKISHYINTYAYEGLHGRALPAAMGIKLTNPNLKVIVLSGDGDGYGIGLNHFLNTARRNIDITYIVHNNALYALTTGQYSPTTPQNTNTRSTPHGSIENPINPILLSASAGSTFIAQTSTIDLNEMKNIFKQAILHKGFAHIDVIQLCPSYNKNINYNFLKENTYKLESPFNKISEIQNYFETTKNKFTTGIFYQQQKQTYEDILYTKIKKIPHLCDIYNIDISNLI